MSLIPTVQKFAASDLVKRVIKTIVEVVGAQTALYTTVVPNPPNTQTSAAIAGAAGVLALVWNALLAWYAKRQDTKLVTLQRIIFAQVEATKAAQAAPAPAPETPQLPPV